MKEKIKLDGVMETMLIPLIAKVQETQSSSPRITDIAAVQMFSKIDYDFEKFSKAMSQQGVIARTMILDHEVAHYISNHPNALCISIGCGLDTRYERIDHKHVTWYNLDFAEVIDLRQKLISEDPHVHYIPKSALDPTWVNDLTNTSKDVLIIIEGVLMYFTESEVKSLLSILKKAFHTCTIYAELMNSFIATQSKHHDTVKKTNATFKWGVRQCKEVEKLCNGLTLKEEWNLFDVLTDQGFPYKLASIIPFIRNKNNKIAKFTLESH